MWFVRKIAGGLWRHHIFGVKHPKRGTVGTTSFLGSAGLSWFLVLVSGVGEGRGGRGGLLVGPFREVPRNRSSIGRGGRNVVTSLGTTDVLYISRVRGPPRGFPQEPGPSVSAWF